MSDPKNSLQGGYFITGNTSSSDVFIPEEWNEEQIMISNTVKDFCLTEIHAIGIEQAAELDIKKDKDLILEVFHKAADLGLCGLSVPEQYGGTGLDFNTGLLFSEGIALGFSFATTIGAQTSIGSLPIVYYGNEEQKQKYLPGIASGQLICAYCLTEPTAGSDANSGKSRAILNEEGTHYILNGQKMWITNGGFANIFIVFAKIDDDKELSAFIIELDFGGITIGKEEKKLGIKGSSTVQLFFSDCKVPKENLLSDRGAGFKIALNILNTGRLKLASGSIGGSKFAIGRAAEYAVEREQFDQPIANFGAIQYKIGEMVMRTYACESGIYRIGKAIDLKSEEFKSQGLTPEEAKLKAVREFAVEAAILKVHGSEVLDYVVDEVLQVHGGMGYAVETGVELGYRDARITRIYEGTNEINRLLSVGELMKRAFKTKEVKLASAVKRLPGKILGQLLPFKSSSDFKKQARTVDNLKNVFLLVSADAGRKLGLKLVDEQEIVMNMADIMAEAFVAESLLLRVQKLCNRKDYDQKKLSVQKDLLNLYLYEATEKVRKAGRDAVNSYTSGFSKSVVLKLIKILLPQYEVNPKELRRSVAAYAIEKKDYPFHVS